MKYLAQAGMVALMVLAAAGNMAYAAADWEWSRDKGWTQGAGVAKDTPAEQLQSAYKLEKSGRFNSAAQQYFLLLKVYPDSQEAGIALQRLAACLFQMEDYYDSFQALQQVIKSYRMSAQKSDLIKIQFLIAKKFEDGARKDLLNDNEPLSVSKQTAIEIYKAVVANDPVGPYAGAATFAISRCYKDLGNPKEGIVYADRVINEFGQSTKLVANARVVKAQLEVMQGTADVQTVKTTIQDTKSMLEDSGDTVSNPVVDSMVAESNFDEEVRELEETQAKKLWDAADFYRRRGSRESLQSYKFSLEQLVVRFPNTTYADKARRAIGKVKVPPPDNSFGKINLPFAEQKKEPSFVVAPNSQSYVDSAPVPVPGTPTAGDAIPGADRAVARVEPITPARRPSPAVPATPEIPTADSTSASAAGPSYGTPSIPDSAPAAIAAPENNPGEIAMTPPANSRIPESITEDNNLPEFTDTSRPAGTPPGMSLSGATPSALHRSRGVTSPASRAGSAGRYVPAPQPSASSAVPSALRNRRTPAPTTSAQPGMSGVSEPIARPVPKAPDYVAPPMPLEPEATPAIPSAPSIPSSVRDAADTAGRYVDNNPAGGPVTSTAPEMPSAPAIPSIPSADASAPVDYTPPKPVTRSNLQLPPLPEGSEQEVEVIREAAGAATSTANDAAAGGSNWKFSEDFE